MKSFKRKVFTVNSITKLQIGANDNWTSLALKKPTYVDIIKVASNYDEIKRTYKAGIVVGVRRVIVVLDAIIGSDTCIELACQATKELIIKGGEVLKIFLTEEVYNKHDLQTTILVNVIVDKMIHSVKPNTKEDSIPNFVRKSLMVLQLPEGYNKYIAELVIERLHKRDVGLVMYKFEPDFSNEGKTQKD